MDEVEVKARNGIPPADGAASARRVLDARMRGNMGCGRVRGGVCECAECVSGGEVTRSPTVSRLRDARWTRGVGQVDRAIGRDGSKRSMTMLTEFDNRGLLDVLIPTAPASSRSLLSRTGPAGRGTASQPHRRYPCLEMNGLAAAPIPCRYVHFHDRGHSHRNLAQLVVRTDEYVGRRQPGLARPLVGADEWSFALVPMGILLSFVSLRILNAIAQAPGGGRHCR